MVDKARLAWPTRSSTLHWPSPGRSHWSSPTAATTATSPAAAAWKQSRSLNRAGPADPRRCRWPRRHPAAATAWPPRPWARPGAHPGTGRGTSGVDGKSASGGGPDHRLHPGVDRSRAHRQDLDPAPQLLFGTDVADPLVEAPPWPRRRTTIRGTRCGPRPTRRSASGAGGPDEPGGRRPGTCGPAPGARRCSAPRCAGRRAVHLARETHGSRVPGGLDEHHPVPP